MAREIVNFQFGNLANYAGSHWWNLQESTFIYTQESGRSVEINHDVMFREGLTLNKEVTYTPRLIAVDLKDCLGSLKLDGVLYEQENSDAICWSHDVTLHKTKPLPKNDYLRDLDVEDQGDDVTATDEVQMKECSSKDEIEETTERTAKGDVFGSTKTRYYNLDASARTWSDYLRPHLHPKTLAVAKSYMKDDDTFNIHNSCTTILKEPGFADDMEDKIHFFTEDCDNLQGFHMLADIYNGFGGLTCAYREEMEEEFPKKGCLMFCPFPTRHTTEVDPSLNYLINSVLSITKLCKSGATVVPLCLTDNPWKMSDSNFIEFPHLRYQPSLDYHTSAVFAAAIDTVTLSHRQKTNCLPLSHLTDTLSLNGRQVSDLSVCLPIPLSLGVSYIDTLTTDSFTSLTPLSHHMAPSRTVRRNVQSLVARGVASNNLLRERIHTLYPHTESAVVELHHECNTSAPFPHLFKPEVDAHGLVSSAMRGENQGVSKVAVAAALASTDATVTMLNYLHERADKLHQGQLHKHIESGLEMDDWADVVGELDELRKRYRDTDLTLDSDSDSSDG